MAERSEADDEGQDDLAWVEDTRCQGNDSDEEFPDPSFHFANQVCFMCEGYYGPCFGQNVCTICHIFLFPDDINPTTEANFSEVRK